VGAALGRDEGAKVGALVGATAGATVGVPVGRATVTGVMSSEQKKRLVR
jgi:hypothetical protein